MASRARSLATRPRKDARRTGAPTSSPTEPGGERPVSAPVALVPLTSLQLSVTPSHSFFTEPGEESDARAEDRGCGRGCRVLPHGMQRPGTAVTHVRRLRRAHP